MTAAGHRFFCAHKTCDHDAKGFRNVTCSISHQKHVTLVGHGLFLAHKNVSSREVAGLSWHKKPVTLGLWISAGHWFYFAKKTCDHGRSHVLPRTVHGSGSSSLTKLVITAGHRFATKPVTSMPMDFARSQVLFRIKICDHGRSQVLHLSQQSIFHLWCFLLALGCYGWATLCLSYGNFSHQN